MSVEVERATVPCSVCGASVVELRRGRCWSCYVRWTESRPVGRGAACTICFEKRRDQLRLVELHGRSLPMCHGCASRVARLEQVPPSIDGVRRFLRRERRDGDRRDDGADLRVFPRERRVGERRGPVRDRPADAEAGLHLQPAELEEVVMEVGEADIEEVEQTHARAAVASCPMSDD